MRSLASLVLLGLSALCGGAHALLKADPDVKTVPPVPNESKSAARPPCPIHRYQAIEPMPAAADGDDEA